MAAGPSSGDPLDDELDDFEDDQGTSREVIPTVAESPKARNDSHSGARGSFRADAATLRRTPGHRTSHGSGTSVSGPSATAARALRGAEMMRARGFARMIAVLSFGALVPLALVYREQTQTPEWLQILTGVALSSSGLVAVLVWRRAKVGGQPERMMRVFGTVCTLTALVVHLYVGVFSPAPALIALGISYFGLVDDRPLAIAVCVGCTVVYTVLVLLVLTGIMPDLGLFAAHTAPMAVKVAALGTVVSVFLFLFWQMRESRAATRLAVERLDEALRQVQEREALLDEANQNLDLALAAGGRRGAYSGRLLGPYRLGELLGRGGMGEVYAAAHQHSAAQAAVKLLPAHVATQHDLVERFMREAELARRLVAPNLVTILELGESEDGVPFLAMERLTGHDLGWHLRRSRRLTLAEGISLAIQVAAGLDVAHRAGVVHRDLKPANLFLVESPLPSGALWKILDFGVAKLKGSHGTLTQHALVGTPGYMSPEQAQSREVDLRSDLFSFGAVLYRALTSRPAFSGADTPQVLFDVVYRCPARPTMVQPSLPLDVDLVLALCLAKDPRDRFASAAELATAFEAASRSALPAELRSRAEAVIRALPWGRTLRPRDDA